MRLQKATVSIRRRRVMRTLANPGGEVASRILAHLVGKIASTPAQDEPFSPIYLEGVFPEDVSRQLLSHLPDPAWYSAAAERHYGRGNGGSVRSMYLLTPPNLAGLPDL